MVQRDWQRPARLGYALHGGEIDQLRDAQVMEIFADVPSVELPKARLGEGVLLVDALVESKLASKQERSPTHNRARRCLR